MQLLPSLLFGISASLDALLVGISYGLRKICIRALQNLAISLVALLGTCLSACLGNRLLPFLPPVLTGCIGSVILMLLGAYYITKWIFTALANHRAQTMVKAQTPGKARTSGETQAPGKAHTIAEIQAADKKAQTPIDEKASMKNPGPGLSAWETFVLSLTLSVNNIGIGLSASMAGLPLLPAAAMTFGCSALFLLSGNRLGQSRFLCLIGNAADPISGLLLIGLGILQLSI